MRLIELKKFKKIGIDYQRTSKLILPEYKSLETDIITSGLSFGDERALALELILPSHCSSYALLGAFYIPVAEYNRLHLEVRYSDDCTEHYEESLSYERNTVFKGLHKQYVDSVFNTAISYLNLIDVPSGKIIFNTAACCEVGSSPFLFGIVTKMVLSILLNTQYPLTDSEVVAIVEKYLEERYICH